MSKPPTKPEDDKPEIVGFVCTATHCYPVYAKPKSEGAKK